MTRSIARPLCDSRATCMPLAACMVSLQFLVQLVKLSWPLA